MTIQEAIKSGKSFKRLGWPNWYSFNNNTQTIQNCEYGDYRLCAVDVLADDWVLEPEPEKTVEVTESQLKDLFKQCLWDVQANKLSSARGDIEGFYFHTLKRIGELFSQ